MNEILREIEDLLDASADRAAGRVGLAERKERLVKLLEEMIGSPEGICRQ